MIEQILANEGIQKAITMISSGIGLYLMLSGIAKFFKAFFPEKVVHIYHKGEQKNNEG